MFERIFKHLYLRLITWMILPIFGIGTGAGILANGIGALFSGEARDRRKQRRETRRGERQERRDLRQEEVVQEVVRGTTRSDIVTGDHTATPPPSGKADIGEMLKKYWWVGLILLFVLKPDILGKPKRNPPRRRPKPKTVIRYRTRKPASRRK